MEDLIFVKKLRGGGFEAKSIAKMRNSRNMLIRNKVRKGEKVKSSIFSQFIVYFNICTESYTVSA